MPFEGPPAAACWRHQGLRSGFEVAYFSGARGGLLIDGTTTGLQDGEPWVVSYRVDLDASWATRTVQIIRRTVAGTDECRLAGDGAGHWIVNGEPAGHLDGCMAIDLESSAMTNALPIHRLGLEVGDRAIAPAAYVGLRTPTVERLEQLYLRIEDHPSGHRYEYQAPSFEFGCRLAYDKSGLVLEYPGIAVRSA